MTETKILPPPLDHTGLPIGLPDYVYATWVSARKELLGSSGIEQGERRYQFCCGYLQALQDSKTLDERIYRFLNNELMNVWVDARNDLIKRGC